MADPVVKIGDFSEHELVRLINTINDKYIETARELTEVRKCLRPKFNKPRLWLRVWLWVKYTRYGESRWGTHD